jgi:hypothetical protein
MILKETEADLATKNYKKHSGTTLWFVINVSGL